MATSETEIANLALSRIGKNNPITSLTENTVAAELCRLHYPICRDYLLRSHLWRFAIRRAALTRITATPAFEFDYAFQLPNDFLRLVRSSLEASKFSGPAIYGYPGINGYANEGQSYRLEGMTISGVATRVIVCNDDTLSIEYVAKVTDVAQFDPMFTDVLAQYLAANICMPLADNASLAESVMAIYKDKLSDARSTGAMEGTPREVVDVSPWIAARV